MENVRMLLLNYNVSDAKYLDLKDEVKMCRVVDVYDGDTITVLMTLFNIHVFKFKVRLAGINTPEVRSSDLDVRCNAFKAKLKLVELLVVYSSESCDSGVWTKDGNTLDVHKQSDVKQFFIDNPVFLKIHCYGFDKYGRLVGDLYRLDKHVSLVDTGGGLDNFNDSVVDDAVDYKNTNVSDHYDDDDDIESISSKLISAGMAVEFMKRPSRKKESL